MSRIGPCSSAGASIWWTWPVKIQIRTSAMTIDRPIVTIVWRSSWPCMWRSSSSWISRPATAAARKPAATARIHQPVRSATMKAT